MPDSDGGPDPRRLYRMPWTAADNAMQWLEPTRKCNITCDACFAPNEPHSDKPLPAIKAEVDAMLRLGKCDTILIAGGEPLTHPGIVDVVRLVARAGVKPSLVTNGVLLDHALLRELKRAGLVAVTFHVDSHQQRPGWTGASERALNELRAELADMVYLEGGVTCCFNTTVFPDALPQVPDIVAWVMGVPDKVQVLTLICVRSMDFAGPFRYLAGDRELVGDQGPRAWREATGELMQPDLYRAVRRAMPGFDVCAFLGGTARGDALKWSIGCVLTTGRRAYGVCGPRTMELLQNAHHFFSGRYLAYAPPRASRLGRLTLLLGVVDPVLRRTALRYLGGVLRHPRELLRTLHVQSISLVQPVDILPNGEMDNCDGCPNRTYFEGRLVPACRLDEYRRYGAPIRAVPRERAAGTAT